MQCILGPIESVVNTLRHVSIDDNAIREYVATIQADVVDGSEFNKDTLIIGSSPEDYIAFALVYDSLNFSFWGDPKWTVSIDGEKYDGSAALIRALKQSVDKGQALLDPHYLAKLKPEHLAAILHGVPEIPLFRERLSFLNQLGEYIADKYHASFTAFVDSAKWDAEKIVRKLATELPEIFDDTHMYKSTPLHFYKRAQLVPAHLHDLHTLGLVSRNVSNFASLTAFADYKVPQLMRSLGILRYSDELSSKVDNLIELEEGSDMEIEIRIATIWANEFCTRYARQRLPGITAAQVDGLFWFAGQKTTAQLQPYHRTRTAWY